MYLKACNRNLGLHHISSGSRQENRVITALYYHIYATEFNKKEGLTFAKCTQREKAKKK